MSAEVFRVGSFSVIDATEPVNDERGEYRQVRLKFGDVGLTRKSTTIDALEVMQLRDALTRWLEAR